MCGSPYRCVLHEQAGIGSKEILHPSILCHIHHARQILQHHTNHRFLVVVLLDLISLQERQESLRAARNRRGTRGCDVSGSLSRLGCVEGGEFGGEVGGKGGDLGSRGGGV